MNKINYSIVISSKDFQGVIYSLLDKSDVMYTVPLQSEDNKLYEYVKQNASGFGDYDSIIIDLGSLIDNDDDIISALEMIRFYDDKIRIIIIEGNRKDSYKLLHKCFQNGIYNLISAGSFIAIKEQLEKCILYGMSYKEALVFRPEEDTRTKSNVSLGIQNKTVAFTGTQHRIGVTHCALAAAYTFRAAGYIVAVVNCSISSDYYGIMESFEQSVNEEGYFSVDDIDYYINPAASGLSQKEESYNFIIYDFGPYSNVKALSEEHLDVYMACDEKIIITGSSPWEVPYLGQTISELTEQEKETIKYLFNMSDAGMVQELRKMMKDAGVDEKRVFVMDFACERFKPAHIMQEIFMLQDVKPKKKLFGRRK